MMERSLERLHAHLKSSPQDKRDASALWKHLSVRRMYTQIHYEHEVTVSTCSTFS